MKLRATIATARSEDIAREAFAMHTHEDILLLRDFALHQSKVMLAVEFGAVKMKLKIAVVRRHLDDFDFLDQLLAAAPVFDEVLDRAEFQFVFFGKTFQFGQA